MSFPEAKIDPPDDYLDCLFEIVCDGCGADWNKEPCDPGCPNDIDTASKVEAGS